METLFNSPDKFQSRFVTVDGYKTHYIEAGEGNPQKLLLGHGRVIEVSMGCYRKRADQHSGMRAPLRQRVLTTWFLGKESG